jgi:hypothetical protein
VGLIAPPVIERLESGKALFQAARGQEVLVWEAKRSLWMAGYFYNDGALRSVHGLDHIAGLAQRGPALVLCGPRQCAALEGDGRLCVERLAAGPRSNVLFRVARRPR